VDDGLIRYFAYGSNLCMTQMRVRTGIDFEKGTPPRIVRLPGHRLAFNMRGDDGNVYANILPPGDGVLGVLYECTAEALAKLDAFEGGYRRLVVEVFDQSDAVFQAFAYVAIPDNVHEGALPSAEYAERILRGGRQHRLPEPYLHGVATLAVAPLT
jgi:gamma-glutamylcyclotransferase